MRETNVQKVYSETLLELAEENNDIVVLDADLAKACATLPFAEKFPERHFQCGVAEQNMVSVAAGLALDGKIPFVNSFGVFLSERAGDQIRVSICFNKTNVKLVGHRAGLSNAYNGATHISVEDIAHLRAMPNMTIVVPGDTLEMKQIIKWAAKYVGPVYICLAQSPLEPIFPKYYQFKIGKAVQLSMGYKATIISTGVMSYYALLAIASLKKELLHVRVIHMPTIKPIDEKAIIKAAKETKRIIVVENHSIYGGLGSAVAEIVCQHHPVRMKILGIPDKFGETAGFEWQLNHFGLSTKHIIQAVKEILKN
jgi:transketolase